MSENAQTYKVLAPVGVSPRKRVHSLAPAVRDFNGKTICAMRHLFRADESFPMLEKLFKERFENITWISNHDMPDERVATAADEQALADVLRAKGCDILLAGNASCGTCAPAVGRAVAAAEKAGIPAVAIIVDDFVRSTQATARAAGVPDMRIAVYPGAIAIHPVEQLDRNVREIMFPQILDLLGADTGGAAEGESDARPAPIAFEGTFEEVNAHFYERGWSDGLPIVPPTQAKVDEFLRFAGRGADEVVATLHPSLSDVTVRAVAVNGVMAGCRPEHMPVLLAMVDVIADPKFHHEDIGSSAGWVPLTILNGPVIEKLGFNCLTGVMRAGNNANSSVPRAFRLMLRNVAGFVPGVGDMGTYGRPDIPVLAENEALSPWEPLSVARGFVSGESVVTMASMGFMSFHVTVVAQGAENILRNIAKKVRLMLLSGDGSAITKGLEMSHILTLSPVIAQTLAAAGYSREDVRNYIYENSKVAAREFDDWLGLQGIPDAVECVKRGMLQPHFAESEDPDRLVPVYHFPHELQIVVSGTENRNRFFLVMNIARQGLATSKKIDMSLIGDA